MRSRRGFLGTVLALIGLVAVAPAAEAVESVPDRVADDPLLGLDLWEHGYEVGERMGYEGAKLIVVPSAVVAGALYDFMGHLTSGEPMTLGRSYTVLSLMGAFEEWAKERGLDVNNADVQGWADRLSTDPT